MDKKITVHEVLMAINDIRKMIKAEQITNADDKLLDLQESLLDGYGDQPQSATFEG